MPLIKVDIKAQYRWERPVEDYPFPERIAEKRRKKQAALDEKIEQAESKVLALLRKELGLKEF